MKKIIAVFILGLTFLTPNVSSAQFFNFGLGTGGDQYVKIGPHARRVLHEYLSDTYSDSCHYSSRYTRNRDRERLPDACYSPSGYYYEGSTLPHRGTRRLPSDVENEL